MGPMTKSNFDVALQFCFQNWKSLKASEGAYIMPPRWDPLRRPPPTPQDYTDYLDPFNCECRAFGRLKEEHREELATCAHGYVLLTKDQEEHITKALGEYVDWETHPEPLYCCGPFRRSEVHRHEPLRAIVKDYVVSSRPWVASQVPQMYANLEELHKLGILVRDIHQGNYLGGKLIDFSMAWTAPHICFERASPAGIKEVRSMEPYKFEKMVDEWAQRHQEEVEKPEGLLKWHSDQEEDFGFDPRLHSWQKRVKIEDGKYF